VEISEFEGQLNPDDFLDWLSTAERVFEYKDIPDDKKVKLVALKIHKYASIWWNNVLEKRARKGKGKIRCWRKIRSKLRDKFLPSHYIQDNFSKLHNIRQEGCGVEEYTQEFERLLMTCDLWESEDQTIVRYLGGLNESIRNVVELQAFSTLDEVSILAHKVESQRKVKLERETPKPPQRTYSFPRREPPPISKSNPTQTIPSNPKPNFPKPPQTHKKGGDAISAKVLAT